MSRTDDHIARLKARGYDWPIPWEAVELLARIEQCRLAAYQCQAGVWTIGWGETEGVTADMRWTEDQVDSRFYIEVRRYTAKLQAILEQPADEYQLGAMLSLAYNIGFGSSKDTKRKRGFYWTSVRRLHNAGDFNGAARAFDLINQYRDPDTGTMRVSNGLTARRKEEAAMYLRTVEGAPTERMPQAVEPESSLAGSPITRTGAATVATGAITGVAAIQEQLGGASGVFGSIKGFADQVVQFIDIKPVWVLVFALVVFGVRDIYWRRKQRDGGWV